MKITLEKIINELNDDAEVTTVDWHGLGSWAINEDDGYPPDERDALEDVIEFMYGLRRHEGKWPTNYGASLWKI